MFCVSLQSSNEEREIGQNQAVLTKLKCAAGKYFICISTTVVDRIIDTLDKCEQKSL